MNNETFIETRNCDFIEAKLRKAGIKTKRIVFGVIAYPESPEDAKYLEDLAMLHELQTELLNLEDFQ